MSDTNAHIAPEPVEAPEPRPARVRDLVRGRALLHGYNTLHAEGDLLISFATWVAGVNAYEDYRQVHDRRRG